MPSFHKIYETERLSVSGAVWGIQIWRLQDSAPESVGELEPKRERGLVIEWKDTVKEDVLCGSVATLTLNSPGDRTYLDLYTDTPGSVQLKVFRNGVLYWTGFMDTEFYEEPFTCSRNYDVTLTFSDFGILERLNYDRTGFERLSAILQRCLESCGLGGLAVDMSYISSRLSPESPDAISLDDFGIRCENFYDEDGNPSTLGEVMEGVLRPFALRITQRAGKIYLYDINGLAESSQGAVLTAGSDDYTLGVDKVYNNIKITLSGYEGDEASDKFEYSGETDESLVNFDVIDSSWTDKGYHSFRSGYISGAGSGLDHSFTLFKNRSSSQAELLMPYLNFFKILPVQGGQEDEGVAVLFYIGYGSRHDNSSGWESDSAAVKRFGYLPGGFDMGGGCAAGQDMFRLDSAYIYGMSESERSRYSLRLQMKLLMDARYNPFTEASDKNESLSVKKLYNTRRVYVPVKIELLDDSGSVLYHYDNRSARGNGAQWSPRAEGSWRSGAAAYDDCELAFDSNPDNWKNANVFQSGWVGNRQNISINATRSVIFKKADYGQYIPVPPEGGRIRITVCSGMRRSEKDYTPLGEDSWKNAHDLLRWILFTVPEITLVNKDATYSEIKAEDVEYEGILNPAARDDLELEEICGTADSMPSTAKSLLRSWNTGEPVNTLTRRNRTAHPEQLLTGTLFSQYSSRKLKISGTVVTDGFPLLKVAHQALQGLSMMIMGERQDCLSGESEIVAVEIVPDEYTEAE